jgi:hypothetical protein
VSGWAQRPALPDAEEVAMSRPAREEDLREVAS